MSFRFITVIFLCSILISCQIEEQGGNETPEIIPEEPKQIKASTSKVGAIEISTEVTANSMVLAIVDAPPDSRLECHLDQIPLTPCHDGAVFQRPTAGDHKITAIAMQEDRIVGLGESKTFTVTGLDNPSQPDDDPMQLALDSTIGDFSNYQIHKINEIFAAGFKFKKVPKCEARLQCAIGSFSSQLWSDCDESGSSFTVTPEMLATGPQTIKVRATCDDTIGRELHFPINAVPETYEPLMLVDHSDDKGRHNFDLLNPFDCLREDKKFECKEPTAEFTDCSNSIDQPTSGLEVRMVCGPDVGPALIVE